MSLSWGEMSEGDRIRRYQPDWEAQSLEDWQVEQAEASGQEPEPRIGCEGCGSIEGEPYRITDTSLPPVACWYCGAEPEGRP